MRMITLYTLQIVIMRINILLDICLFACSKHKGKYMITVLKPELL